MEGAGQMGLFDYLKEVVIGVPGFIKGITENADDFKNDVKVTTKDFKKDVKKFSREVSVDVANKISPALGDKVENLHEVEDKLSEKVQNFGEAVKNPSQTGKAVKSDDLYSGDHIYVYRIGYTHHGIYVGDNEVIHFAPDASSEAYIHAVTLEKFAGGNNKVYRLSKNNSPTRYSGTEVSERAREKLYEGTYNLVFNNCEHYARWCRLGEE
jgi:hypothetical protein